MSVDYRQLLLKYIALVILEEGATYTHCAHAGEVFSQEDVDELAKLQAESDVMNIRERLRVDRQRWQDIE
jgi:hypothetical protein